MGLFHYVLYYRYVRKWQCMYCMESHRSLPFKIYIMFLMIDVQSVYDTVSQMKHLLRHSARISTGIMWK